MIAYLQGRLLAKEPTRAVIETGGVGYEVFIPVTTFYELGKEGEEALLHIHTHVRDDAIELYGFNSHPERSLFRRLISISGVGPKLALSVLSGMAPADLLSAVEAGEYHWIVQIPGIGKKTAERLVLELKDKLPDLRLELEVTAPAPGTPAALKKDLISALVNLGYKRRDAEKAAEAAIKKSEAEAGFSEMLKRALAELTGLD